MRIVFAGTPEFARKALEALLEKHYHVVAVYTQPDRKAGRGQTLQSSPVKKLAEQHHISVEQPDSLKDPSMQSRLAYYQPDLMIVAAYGLLLPQSILDTPHLGCINIHASLLPRWRGAAPIQRAIEANDVTTGITIMEMEAGLDTGPMLLKKSIPIAPTETSLSLHDKLAHLGADSIIEALVHFDKLKRVVQDESKASYAKKMTKAEACIRWDEPALVIERKIRAFKPWPIAFTHFKETRVRIFEASVLIGSHEHSPGEIFEYTPQKLLVACGTDVLNIHALQLENGKIVRASELFHAKQQLFLNESFY